VVPGRSRSSAHSVRSLARLRLIRALRPNVCAIAELERRHPSGHR
jgi:hypothetical protein